MLQVRVVVYEFRTNPECREGRERREEKKQKMKRKKKKEKKRVYNGTSR